jgi:hypothetical protein
MNASAASGVFAIRLSLGPGITSSSPNNGVVRAMNNLYDDAALANPDQIVKDGVSNTFSGGPLVGQGTIIVGAVQLTRDQEFVQALYKTFVARAAGPSELQMATARLAFETRTQLASDVVHADESYKRQIDLAYREYLNRAPDPGGKAAFLGLLQSNHTLEFIDAIFLSSNEYFNRALAANPLMSPNDAYIVAIVGVEDRRMTMTSDYDFYEGMLIATPGNPMAARQVVASTIVETPEALRNRIRDYYHEILNRNSITSDGEIQGWLNTGLDLLSIQFAMAGSDEFYMRA